jgi:predicted enzyme related to lactoylglutathione lyase
VRELTTPGYGAVMPHRSRLTAVLVDVPKADHERAVNFWASALGSPGKTVEKYPEYHFFGQPTPGVEFMVQATGDDGPRIHIDIESDDVEAEVERLKKLGAVEVDRHNTWVIMRDPVGTVFCVVRVQVQEAFDKHAKSWD